MHHGDEHPASGHPRQSEVMRKIMREMEEAEKEKLDSAVQNIASELQLGATRHYPDGALNETDEGEIKIGVGVEDGKVILSFGKPVAWLGFDARQARQLAESLRKASYKTEG